MTLDRLRHIARLRLRSLYSGSAVDRELDEELRYHVERQVELNIERGMAPTAARTAALRAMGGIEQRTSSRSIEARLSMSRAMLASVYRRTSSRVRASSSPSVQSCRSAGRCSRIPARARCRALFTELTESHTARRLGTLIVYLTV